MQTCREIYEKLVNRNFKLLNTYNPALSKDDWMVEKFRRAANLIAVEQTQIEWRKQYEQKDD